MPISSLIVRTRKEQTQEVADKLKDFAGVDVEKVEGARIVIVTDTTEQKKDKELWNNIENISGVLQCDLIYHNFEDEEGF